MPPAMPPSAPIGSVSHRRPRWPSKSRRCASDAADHARPQRDGVGDVGGDGRHADRGQRREGHQRPAARDRVHEAGGHPGQGDQGVLQRGRRHRAAVHRHRPAIMSPGPAGAPQMTQGGAPAGTSQAMSEQAEGRERASRSPACWRRKATTMRPAASSIRCCRARTGTIMSSTGWAPPTRSSATRRGPRTGSASPPTPGSHACHGSSATRGSSRSVVTRRMPSSSPMSVTGATLRSPPVAVDDLTRHPRLATRRVCWCRSPR